jgi:hypothetical protein
LFEARRVNRQLALGFFCDLAEASLSGVEPLMQKIQSEIRRVDASILAAVRQQVRAPVVPCFVLCNVVVLYAGALCIRAS